MMPSPSGSFSSTPEGHTISIPDRDNLHVGWNKLGGKKEGFHLDQYAFNLISNLHDAGFRLDFNNPKPKAMVLPLPRIHPTFAGQCPLFGRLFIFYEPDVSKMSKENWEAHCTLGRNNFSGFENIRNADDPYYSISIGTKNSAGHMETIVGGIYGQLGNPFIGPGDYGGQRSLAPMGFSGDEPFHPDETNPTYVPYVVTSLDFRGQGVMRFLFHLDESHQMMYGTDVSKTLGLVHMANNEKAADLLNTYKRMGWIIIDNWANHSRSVWNMYERAGVIEIIPGSSRRDPDTAKPTEDYTAMFKRGFTKEDGRFPILYSGPRGVGSRDGTSSRSRGASGEGPNGPVRRQEPLGSLPPQPRQEHPPAAPAALAAPAPATAGGTKRSATNGDDLQNTPVSSAKSKRVSVGETRAPLTQTSPTTRTTSDPPCAGKRRRGAGRGCAALGATSSLRRNTGASATTVPAASSAATSATASEAVLGQLRQKGINASNVTGPFDDCWYAEVDGKVITVVKGDNLKWHHPNKPPACNLLFTLIQGVGVQVTSSSGKSHSFGSTGPDQTFKMEKTEWGALFQRSDTSLDTIISCERINST